MDLEDSERIGPGIVQFVERVLWITPYFNHFSWSSIFRPNSIDHFRELNLYIGIGSILGDAILHTLSSEDESG